ncbi:hypothetical protein F5I97DRAFT_1669731 [Phlebopus sp. FC_14]|nr:hypothetical protein F5I97DRAFT_1669731 [Phlebopus sp. FC_14]
MSVPKAIPLPTNPFPESAFGPAYKRCLDLEAAASRLKAPPGCPPPIISARLLGHLLRIAPPGNGQGQVQRDIMNASDDNALMEVASVYQNGFIRAFKRSKGPTPAPSEHPSRPSFEDARAYSLQLMEEGKLDHRCARDAAMLRDDYRCVVTGTRDLDHGGHDYVEAAHIIPESTTTDINAIERKHFLSGGVWTILAMFTDVSIITELAGNKIYRLENLVMMNPRCHHLFDDLRFWLKPVEGAPNTYTTHLGREDWRHDIPHTVILATTTDLPLPCGAYFALHALCCEVAWMSGAAEYIMEIERRMDQTWVLANDGSTADLLARALSFITLH